MYAQFLMKIQKNVLSLQTLHAISATAVFETEAYRNKLLLYNLKKTFSKSDAKIFFK